MGTIYIVATPIGNLGDMTYRAVEVLRAVRYIAAEDTRHIMPLLNKYSITSRLLSLHKYNEQHKSALLVDKVCNEGCDIALVSDAGTPCISDPGSVLVQQARHRQVPVVGIPGACALTLALSVCGLDTSSCAFLGFYPRIAKHRSIVWQTMRSPIHTYVLYESPHRILDTLRQLAQQFGHAEVAICKELTKIHERVLYGHISTVLADLEQDVYATKGEYVIVISPNYTPPTDRQLSIEAYLIDCLTQGHDLKIAIAKVAAQYNFGKNAVYQASLHLKALLSSQ